VKTIPTSYHLNILGECRSDWQSDLLLPLLFEKIPHIPFIIVEDALSANAPHIRKLQRHKLHFILGVKPGDHAHLFDYVAQAHARGDTTEFERQVAGVTQRFRYLNDAPLNASNLDVRVNFLEYWEIQGNQVQHFTWITDFHHPRQCPHVDARGPRPLED